MSFGDPVTYSTEKIEICEFFQISVEAFKNKNKALQSTLEYQTSLEYLLSFIITESSEHTPLRILFSPDQMGKQTLGEVKKLAPASVVMVRRARIQILVILTLASYCSKLTLVIALLPSCLWRSYTFPFANLTFAFLFFLPGPYSLVIFSALLDPFFSLLF